jgi:hypothetical protein
LPEQNLTPLITNAGKKNAQSVDVVVAYASPRSAMLVTSFFCMAKQRRSVRKGNFAKKVELAGRQLHLLFGKVPLWQGSSLARFLFGKVLSGMVGFRGATPAATIPVWIMPPRRKTGSG